MLLTKTTCVSFLSVCLDIHQPHQLIFFFFFLQKNVEGKNCDRCKPGFYNLKERNPEGCSECFCFGVSGVCDSLTWSISQVGDPATALTSRSRGHARKPGGQVFRRRD